MAYPNKLIIYLENAPVMKRIDLFNQIDQAIEAFYSHRPYTSERLTIAFEDNTILVSHDKTNVAAYTMADKPACFIR